MQELLASSKVRDRVGYSDILQSLEESKHSKEGTRADEDGPRFRSRPVLFASLCRQEPAQRRQELHCKEGIQPGLTAVRLSTCIYRSFDADEQHYRGRDSANDQAEALSLLAKPHQA